MKLFEMEGFLHGKCLPGDMKVNETNAEYLVRKFAALEQQLAESQSKLEKMAAEIYVINADNAYLRDLVLGWSRECDRITYTHTNKVTDAHQSEAERVLANTSPATDAFWAEVRAQSHKEGAHFVANRMLAAWDAGFIDDTAKNAADIARMILTSTEFMAEAPEGDFDRSFADGVLEDIAAQLRQGGAV